MTPNGSETVEQERSWSAASNLLLGHALCYIARGMSVFPLHARGKTPLTPHGLKDATLDTEQIRKWWTRWPTANIGVTTGRLSDLAVLDVDGEAGERSLQALPEPLPATWCSLTRERIPGVVPVPGTPGDSELSGEARHRVGCSRQRRLRGRTSERAPERVDLHVHRSAAETRRMAGLALPAKNEALRATESARTYAAGLTPRPDRYAAVALEREVRILLATPEGQRNEQLNRGVHAVARLDALSTAGITAAFTAAALRIGLDARETEATIKSALEARGR